jgi:methenyltetrahydrofolate cyclohydrolase
MSMEDDVPPPDPGRYPPVVADRPRYLGIPLGQFLELISASRPAPGGGAAAALAVALAAGLCAMAARLSSTRLPSAGELVKEAERLRDHAAQLSEADAEAYGRVIEALRLPKQAAPAAEAGIAAAGAGPGRPKPGTTAAGAGTAAAEAGTPYPEPGTTAAGAGTAAAEAGTSRPVPGGARQAAGRQQAVADALSAAADVPLAVAETASQVARLAARLAEQGNPNLRGDAVTAALLAEAGARAAAALVEINLAGMPGDARLARAADLVRDAAQSARDTSPPS